MDAWALQGTFQGKKYTQVWRLTSVIHQVFLIVANIFLEINTE